MKHLKKGRKLGRKVGPRKILLKNLAKSLILYEKIETTEAKAKELRPFIEKIITRGRVDSLHNRRLIISSIGDVNLTDKVVKVLSPKYKERKGGYTRITKTGLRVGDAAKMAIIEFV